MYYEKDADLGLLKGKKIAIVGYGSQGHAQALNLKDSGLNVVVAELKGSDNYNKAVEAGWKPVTAAEATKDADWIQILVNDELQGRVWRDEIKPNIKKGATLAFSHGFNIRFGQPSRDGHARLNLFYPTDIFPFSDLPQTDSGRITHRSS